MSNSEISYTSVGQAISEAVAKYKRNESIEDCLLWINEDEDRLMEWEYETNTFSYNDDFVFLISEEELFIKDDNLLEYFDVEQLDLKKDSDILAFISKRGTTVTSDGDLAASHFHNRDGVYLTVVCELWGQAGPHYSRFNICSSKEEYFNYLKGQGFILWLDNCKSHTDNELISMFRKNVTDKYFRGDSSS